MGVARRQGKAEEGAACYSHGLDALAADGDDDDANGPSGASGAGGADAGGGGEVWWRYGADGEAADEAAAEVTESEWDAEVCRQLWGTFGSLIPDHTNGPG
jgi:hypothetical protein